MALSDEPGQRHREIGRVFTDKVNSTRSWDVPAPVPDWTGSIPKTKTGLTQPWPVYGR